MSRLGFQLFRMSIKRTGATTTRWTGLRCISVEPSIHCPSSEEFGLLGPPEVPRSTSFVNQFPDDYKIDKRRDKINKTRERLCDLLKDDLPNPCSFFCTYYIGTKRPFDLKSHVFLKDFLELSWHHCPETILKIICYLKSSSHFSKQSREDFYTAAMWLHQHHSETLAHNVRAFARFGCLKDFLEILYRIINGPRVRGDGIVKRNIVMKEHEKRLMAERTETEKMQRKRQEIERQTREGQQRRELLCRLMVKRMSSKEIQKRRREERKRLIANRMKSKVMQKRIAAHLREAKRIMMAKKAIERYKYDPKYRRLHNQISSLFAELLKADLEYLISGQLAKISLASKWCPSLDSSYDRSTLFCESVARKLFPYDSCPEYRELDEAHYAYRVRDRLRKQVLVPLRKALELPEIYMSANQWNLLRYDRITCTAMKTHKRLFYKHDRDGLLRHLQNMHHPKLLPHEILSFLDYDSGHEVAELQWKRMIDTYSSKAKFVNCISVVNDRYQFHREDNCKQRFCLAFQLMASELCASPWRGKVLTYTINPEFVDIEGDDLGSRINFLRSLPICKYSQPKKSREYPKLIHFLDRILETAKDLKLSKENMIERVFVFDNYDDCECLEGWEENYGTMCEKYESYGYVMPKIVHWKFWHGFLDVYLVEGGIAKTEGLKGNYKMFFEACVTKTLKGNYRMFFESDGTMSQTVRMESKIRGEDYLKLVVVRD